ncbi:MAG: hypothetical protein ABI878_15260 [Acidobacteriota bacterium]
MIRSMIHALSCFILLLTVSVSSLAQISESFDIASFTPPAGWAKQAKDGGLLFSTSDQKKGAYAMIVLYQSDLGSGDPKRDFDNDWRQFIVGAFGVKDKPQMEPQKQADGWTITNGGATFTGELGASAIILSTYSGFGRKFSAAAIFNSQEYIQTIDTFATSIVLRKSAANTPAQAVTTQMDSPVLGTWGQNLGAHMTYGDPVAAGMAGYSKDQYTFNSNGTYIFVSKTFRMSYDKILLVRENGTYQINGGSLSIKPQKSVIQAWSKLNGGDGFGRLLTTQNRGLETVTYRFTKHYFSGIDQWQLVLQADKPTMRDGPFSTLTTFTNAWYYKPISSNNPVIELPR